MKLKCRTYSRRFKASIGCANDFDFIDYHPEPMDLRDIFGKVNK